MAQRIRPRLGDCRVRYVAPSDDGAHGARAKGTQRANGRNPTTHWAEPSRGDGYFRLWRPHYSHRLRRASGGRRYQDSGSDGWDGGPLGRLRLARIDPRRGDPVRKSGVSRFGGRRRRRRATGSQLRRGSRRRGRRQCRHGRTRSIRRGSGDRGGRNIQPPTPRRTPRTCRPGTSRAVRGAASYLTVKL